MARDALRATRKSTLQSTPFYLMLFLEANNALIGRKKTGRMARFSLSAMDA